MMRKILTALSLVVCLLVCSPVAHSSSSVGASLQGGGKIGGRTKGFSTVIIMMDDMGSEAWTIFDDPRNQPGPYSPSTGGYPVEQLPNLKKMLANGINFRGFRTAGICGDMITMLTMGTTFHLGLGMKSWVHRFDPSVRMFSAGKGNYFGTFAHDASSAARVNVNDWFVQNASKSWLESLTITHPALPVTTTDVLASTDTNLYQTTDENSVVHSWGVGDDMYSMAVVDFINNDVYGTNGVPDADSFWVNEKAPVYIATILAETVHKPLFDYSNVVNGVVHPSAATKAHWNNPQTWIGQTTAVAPVLKSDSWASGFAQNSLPVAFASGATDQYPLATHTYIGGTGSGAVGGSIFPGGPSVDPSGAFAGPWDNLQMSAINNAGTSGTIQMWEFEKINYNAWMTTQILMDRMVGRLIDGIGENRLRDVSIILSGDNGSLYTSGMANSYMYGQTPPGPSMAHTDMDMTCNWAAATQGTGCHWENSVADQALNGAGGRPAHEKGGFSEVPWLVAYGPVSTGNRGSSSEVLLNPYDISETIASQLTGGRYSIAADPVAMGLASFVIQPPRDFTAVYSGNCSGRSPEFPMVPGCDNPGGNFDFRIVSTAGGNNGTSTQIGELGSATAAMTADGHLYDLVRTTFANQPANGEDWVRDLRDPLYYADLRSTINPSAPTTALDTIYNMLNSEMISAGSRAEGVAP